MKKLYIVGSLLISSFSALAEIQPLSLPAFPDMPIEVKLTRDTSSGKFYTLLSNYLLENDQIAFHIGVGESLLIFSDHVVMGPHSPGKNGYLRHLKTSDGKRIFIRGSFDSVAFFNSGRLLAARIKGVPDNEFLKIPFGAAPSVTVPCSAWYSMSFFESGFPRGCILGKIHVMLPLSLDNPAVTVKTGIEHPVLPHFGWIAYHPNGRIHEVPLAESTKVRMRDGQTLSVQGYAIFDEDGYFLKLRPEN